MPSIPESSLQIVVNLPGLCFSQPPAFWDSVMPERLQMFAEQINACDAPGALALDTRVRNLLQAVKLFVTLLFANKIAVHGPSWQRPGSPPPREALHP